MSRIAESIRVDVTFHYVGQKASYFRPPPADVRTDIVLADLDELRCVHPKRSSISVPRPGIAHFYWVNTYSKSTLMKTVTTKLKPSNPVYQETIDKLSIQRITVKMSNDDSNFPQTSTHKVYIPGPTSPIKSEHTPSSPASLINRIGDVAYVNMNASISSSRPSTQLSASPPPPPPPQSAPVFPPRIKQEKDIEDIRFGTSTVHDAPRPSKRPRSLDRDRFSSEITRPAQRPRRNEETSSTISHHLDRLKFIRQNIAEFRSKERELIDTIKSLDPNVDLGSYSDVDTRFEEEKKRRIQAEEALEDVRRECKHPFVVPQIMDAFIKVSKLTTKAMNGDSASNM